MSTNNHQVVDYDSVLDAKFGKMGSLERMKHEEEARAFYVIEPGVGLFFRLIAAMDLRIDISRPLGL